MSYNRFTTEQRIWLIKQKYLLHSNITVQRLWAKEWKENGPAPDGRTINNLFNKWEATGSILDLPRSGRGVTVTTVNAKATVQQHFQQNPSSSAKRAALELGISRRSLCRLMKQSGLKLYRPRLVHELNEDDYDRRQQFCEEMLHAIQRF